MEEDLKYYTPEISEFHINFEFEFFEESGKLVKDHPANKSEWKSEICDWSWLDTICDDYEHNKESISKLYRVKYLDKENIETILIPFGFKEEDDKYSSQTICKYIKGDIYQTAIIVSLFNDKQVKVTKYDYKGEHDRNNYFPIFWGELKNVSEFKKLIQQLNIIK